MSSIQNEDILDELDDLFEKINQIVADHESVDLDFYLKQSNYSLRKAKGAIEAMIARAERRARIKELSQVDDDLVGWGKDGMSVHQRLAELHHLPEDPEKGNDHAEP